ncbi:hypothetical protein GCM10018966_075000 [Streptomyces yanii]
MSGDAADIGGKSAGPVVPVGLARRQAVDRLLALDVTGALTTSHVRLVADGAGVSLRTVWRWLAAARAEGRVDALPRGRFTVTAEVHARLVLCVRERGGGAPGAAGRGGGDVPSLATLQRAVRRDLSPGQRAALAGGERARRRGTMCICGGRGSGAMPAAGRSL